MKNYVFTNSEKERIAREVVKEKGTVRGYRADSDGIVRIAQVTLYNKALKENPKITDEELILYVYKGLGGMLEEYETEEKAQERANKLKTIRIKQAKKDADL